MARLVATMRGARQHTSQHHRLHVRLPTRSEIVAASAARLSLLIFFVLLSALSPPAAAASPKCLNSLPPHRFDTKPPRPSNSLTFCKEYSPSTCCNATHTQTITRQLYPYFSTTFDERDEGYGVNEECRQLVASLHCSACHPMVGTGQLLGVCRDSCDALYTACASALFEYGNGLLQPCSPSTLVCSELSAFVRSGEDLCRHLGFSIGSSSPAPLLPSLRASTAVSSSDLHSAFTGFLSASQSTEQPSCFHASSSPSSLSPSTTKRTAAKTATTSTTTPTSSPFTSLTTTFSSLSTVLSTLPKLLASLPTTVVQWRKHIRRMMRSHFSSGVSIAVFLAVVAVVMMWPRIRGWLSRQRWKARLTADSIRRQRVARLGNNR